MKKARWSSILVAAMLLAVAVIAEAQQAKKIPRIGFLSALDRAAVSSRVEAIRLALRELGYIDGQNIAIEYRSAEGKTDRPPSLRRARASQSRYHRGIRGGHHPGGQERDQDDSHRYGGRWDRSGRGRPD